jgi:hypothetical protein
MNVASLHRKFCAIATPRLITVIIAMALGNGAFATEAIARGVPGHFGGCLAHGQFDGSISENFAGARRDAGTASMPQARRHRSSWQRGESSRQLVTQPRALGRFDAGE